MFQGLAKGWVVVDLFLASAVARLVLNQIRDDIIIQDSVQTIAVEETEHIEGNDFDEVHRKSKVISVDSVRPRIISDKSLMVYGIINFASLFVLGSPIHVMNAIMGWEISGIFYRTIHHYFK